MPDVVLRLEDVQPVYQNYHSQTKKVTTKNQFQCPKLDRWSLRQLPQGEKVFAPSKARHGWHVHPKRTYFEDWDQKKFSNQHCDTVYKFQVIVGPKAGPRLALGIGCSLVERTKQ